MPGKTFMAAAKEYFGYKDGQGLKEFAAEVKQLSHESKMELAALLRAAGLDCNDPLPDTPKPTVA